MLFCKGFWKQHLLKRKKTYLWPSCPTYENMSYRNKITKSHWFMYNGFIRGIFFFRYQMPGKVIEHLINLYNLKYKTLHFQSSLIQTAKKIWTNEFEHRASLKAACVHLLSYYRILMLTHEEGYCSVDC